MTTLSVEIRCRTLCCLLLMAGLLFADIQAAPSITSVTQSAETVGKYEKFELAIDLSAAYTNPFDPGQVDLSATFTSPSSKTWNINGFYDSLLLWRIRFAPNEPGTYTYTVSVTDSTGTSPNTTGSFACTASPYHGWVTIAPNKRYFCYDDGTPFYGIGCNYCWDVSEKGIKEMLSYGMNTWIYWNGTHITNPTTRKEELTGGYNMIEAPIGRYDHGQCTYIDSQVTWGETHGLAFWLVIWPHDYLAQNMSGSWVTLWSANAYNTICKSADLFYSDTLAWKYQEKLYRYIIARWGYSRALEGWQTVDEISGTDGWSKNKAAANKWVKKIASYFHDHDPFGHPTCGSLGDYWAVGDSAHRCTNTENYGSTTPSAWATIVNKLWKGWEKPAISGECTPSDAHTNIWACLALGEAMTPMMWQFNQGWTASRSKHFPPLAKFVEGINFAALTNLSQAKMTVSGATVYGIKSDQVTWGWMTEGFSGKTLTVNDMPDDAYSVEWFDCTGGTVISTGKATVNGTTLSATIPTTGLNDIAFKINPPPTEVVVRNTPPAADSRAAITFRHGVLYLSAPLTANCVIKIMNAQGRTIAQRRITGPDMTAVPMGYPGAGVYFVKYNSGGKERVRRLSVMD